MSSEAAESAQAFIDKVLELAETNGLSSKTYASLSEISVDNLRKQLNQVSDFVSWSFYSSKSVSFLYSDTYLWSY